MHVSRDACEPALWGVNTKNRTARWCTNDVQLGSESIDNMKCLVDLLMVDDRRKTDAVRDNCV